MPLSLPPILGNIVASTPGMISSGSCQLLDALRYCEDCTRKNVALSVMFQIAKPFPFASSAMLGKIEEIAGFEIVTVEPLQIIAGKVAASIISFP